MVALMVVLKAGLMALLWVAMTAEKLVDELADLKVVWKESCLDLRWVVSLDGKMADVMGMLMVVQWDI